MEVDLDKTEPISLETEVEPSENLDSDEIDEIFIETKKDDFNKLEE